MSCGDYWPCVRNPWWGFVPPGHAYSSPCCYQLYVPAQRVVPPTSDASDPAAVAKMLRDLADTIDPNRETK